MTKKIAEFHAPAPAAVSFELGHDLRGDVVHEVLHPRGPALDGLARKLGPEVQVLDLRAFAHQGDELADRGGPVPQLEAAAGDDRIAIREARHLIRRPEGAPA